MKRQLKNFKRKRWLIALAAIIIQLCLGTGSELERFQK